MKTYRQLAMGLLALMICIALPSCSDDDENDNQTNELTLNWEIEASDDLLNVANIAYTLYEGQEEMPEPELIVSNGIGSKITGKAPCTLGAIFNLAPKEEPDTQKASYDLTLSVKVSLTNAKGQVLANSFSLDKKLSGVPADQIEKSLRSLQKLLDSAESIYIVDASGQVKTASPMPEPEKASDLQALQEALFITDESGKQQPLLGQALDAARPDVLSVRVNDLYDAKATFLRWMPDAKQVITTGDNLTWTLTDEKGNTLGNAYFTATDNAGGQVAKVTFDAAVQPQGITQLNFLLSSAWPLNSTLKHFMGEKKRAKAIRVDSYNYNTGHFPWPDGEVDCYCINHASDDELAYYVGLNYTGWFYTNYEKGIMEQLFSLLPSEQTAKAIQDIFNKPEEKGGRGWDYYREFLKERTGKDIDDRSANVWINRWYIEDGWYYKNCYYCYEIDLDNGYQDYELTEHWLPMKIPAGLGAWFMHVLVYKGDRLIEGWEIK